jgi:hypothetical protein
MYKYSYSVLEEIPGIASELAKTIPNECLLVINSAHMTPREEFMALEISKNVKKEKVRIGFELLPSSFTTASYAERKAFFDHLDGLDPDCPSPEYPCPAGALREILSLSSSVHVYGMRPLPYETSKGLVPDFYACLSHYSVPIEEEATPKEREAFRDKVNQTYAKLAVENRLDLLVLGDEHIDPVSEMVGSSKPCMKVMQGESVWINNPAAVVLQHP